jgi:hypothetical protein
MMTDNELLLAISNIVEQQTKPIKLTLENDILPRLQAIESCYLDTYRRYQTGNNDIEHLKSDVELMKNVIMEHSEKLKKIS